MSIRVKNLSKSFIRNGNSKHNVISDLNLNIDAKFFYSLVGQNGCGKTTLLNLMAGILNPDSGEIQIDVTHNSTPRIGYVWQDYRSSLLPWEDVGENISFPLRIQGMTRKERRNIAEDLLEQFECEILIDQPVYDLSGGQQQMVSLLRSYTAEPDLLLMDEPLSALDQSNRWIMASQIERYWINRKIPIVFVSHDVDEAVMLADEILLMSRGSGQITGGIVNSLPRPREVRMLTSVEHIRCKKIVIEFLLEEGAIKS